MLSATQIALVGKRPGRTSVFLWDDVGNVGALDLQVTKATNSTKADKIGSESGKTIASRNVSSQQSLPAKQQISADKANPPSDSTASSSSSRSRHECEIWTGSKKDIASLVLGKDQLCNNDYAATGFPDRDALIALNNEAVKAINSTNYARAIELLERALEWSPQYKTALINLGIAYNNFGLSLQNKPAEAIPYFHRAIYLDASNETTQENLNGLIRKLGKDPDSFSDRVALGDEATSHGDTKGSIIEYQAALKLKEEPSVRAKLAAAIANLKKSGMSNL
jgi:tetratricopeptide (TPR) repeat protein